MARARQPVPKTKHISLRVTPAEFQALDDAAYAQRRTMSAVIQELIENYLKSLAKKK